MLMHLVVIVELIEVIHQFLVVLNCQMRLHLLHVLDLFFVATQLLLHLGDDLVRGRVTLLDVGVSALKLVGLGLHVFEKFVDIL